MGKKFDAFISYRHAELDIFVAENIQKELEKFKLPKKLVKAGGKNKIERIFRDKDELALASDLSAPIYEALQFSDFLIVICSPRVVESIWCRKEISTFIALHGRNHVLAVLIEGEPREAFPVELTKEVRSYTDQYGNYLERYNDVEPLAADVRGKDKKEIKKKIKSEILRLVSVMFGVEYNELRQRKRDEGFKKTFIASIGMTVFFAAFALFSFMQNAKIKAQSKEIQKQYSEIVVSNAIDLLDSGMINEALKSTLEAIPEDLDELPIEARDRLQKILSEELGVYDDGTNIRPLANFESATGIIKLSVSDDEKYLLVHNYDDSVTVWSLETYKKLGEFHTNGTSLSDNVTVGFYNDNILWYDERYVGSYNLTTGKENFKLDCKGYGSFTINKERGKVFALSYCSFTVFDAETGEVYAEKEFDSDEYNYVTMLKYDYANDYVYGASIGGMSTRIFCIDVNSLQEIYSKEYKTFVEAGTFIQDKGTFVYALQGVFESSDSTDSEYDVGKTMYNIYAIDSSTLSERLLYQSNDYVDGLYNMKGESVLVKSSSELKVLDLATGQEKNHYKLPRYAEYVGEYVSGQFVIVYANGIIEMQNFDAFEFSEANSKSVPYGRYSNIIFSSGCILAVPDGKSTVVLYSKQGSPYVQDTAIANSAFTDIHPDAGLTSGTYISRDGKCQITSVSEGLEISINGEQKIYKKNSKGIEGFGTNEDNTRLIIGEIAGKIRVVDMNTFETIYEMTGSMYGAGYIDLDDNYYAVVNYDEAEIVSKKTNICVAKVTGFKDYDKNEKEFYISNTYSDETLKKVKFFSLEELINMAKEKYSYIKGD